MATLFNHKARLWVRGRKNLFLELETKIKSSEQPIVWFHCASLGEFEQGRPLMEAFKKQYPHFRILLTFFSPSGYEVRKNYSGADIISYLPLDTKSNADRFITLVNPSIVFFVKYEFWINTLNAIHKKGIPLFLISAIFRHDQIFFKNFGGIFREALKAFTFLFTQDENSILLLKSIQISNAIAAGDTRFDRVKEIYEKAVEINQAVIFSGADKKIIVAGSTWPEDEIFLIPAISEKLLEDWKLIIAPHELGEDHLCSIEKEIEKAGIEKRFILRFSNSANGNLGESKVLIIDNIGMLSSLYQYGSVAYIGGGFGKSIHNTLEAAVYGIPVIFGPQFEKFDEAKRLIISGGGYGVKDKGELNKTMKLLLSNKSDREIAGANARKFVLENTGATKIILDKIPDFISH